MEMNGDGTISSLRLKDVAPDMIAKHRSLGMMSPDTGTPGHLPVQLVLMFDGFPVNDLSIVHYCIANASLDYVRA